MNCQQTLRAPIRLSGVGLHTGRFVRVHVLPAPGNSGIRFRRVDVAPAVEVAADSRSVVDTTLATVLGRDGVEVSTVEHCLAALSGLAVDNAVVEVDGPELPILDGSALPWVEALVGAGTRCQRALRRVLRMTKAVRVAEGDKFCILRPASGLRLTYTVDFDGRLPEVQHSYLEVTPASFAYELAPARTFGFLQEVEHLRAIGKARGGSLENAVVLDEGRVLNPGGLRMPQELVRHKMLDLIGDLALAGVPIQGHLLAHKAGHALHARLVEAVLASPDAWVLVAPGRADARIHTPDTALYPLAAAHA